MVMMTTTSVLTYQRHSGRVTLCELWLSVPRPDEIKDQLRLKANGTMQSAECLLGVLARGSEH